MLQFIETGSYIPEAAMAVQFPHVSLLDLHIHAYLAGAKYKVPTLCTYSITQYIELAQMILDIRPSIIQPAEEDDADDDDIFSSFSSSSSSSSLSSHYYYHHHHYPPPPPPPSPLITDPNLRSSNVLESSPTPPTPSTSSVLPDTNSDADTEAESLSLHDILLNSFVLLWRNTPDRNDALRTATLELIKLNIHILIPIDFFTTLMLDMAAFGDDIVDSLHEDGLDVRMFPGSPGTWSRWDLRFG